MARSDRKPAAVTDIKALALSMSLLAGIELGLFARLRAGELNAQALLAELGVEPEIGKAWLEVLRAGGYLEGAGESLSPTARAVPLVEDDGSLAAWGQEMGLLARALVDLPEVLRSGNARSTALSAFWAYKSAAGEVARRAAAYSKSMDVSMERHASEVLKLWNFGAYARVADLGGGYGGFARRLLRAYPALEVVVVDLPAVVASAPPAEERLSFVAADLFADVIEGRFDAVIFNRVLHDWGDADALLLLKRARSLVVPGGHVIVAEKLAPEAALDLDQAATALMLALLGGARRNAARYAELMRDAGLEPEAVAGSSEAVAAVVVGRRNDEEG